LGKKERIRNKALELGFSRVGFTTPERIPGKFLMDWLFRKAEGTMAYMRRNPELRLNPRALFPPVKTIIVLAANYYPGKIEYGRVKISRYALGRDYHRVLKKMMRRLFDFVKEEFPGVQGRFFVDSAPVMEKELARRAGLGWIGKNTLLITREYGSWVFLGEIFISVSLPPDEPFQENHCGTCNRCVDACPTGALKPYFLDARLCLSYITVEHKGEIPEVYRRKNGGWVFGCDVCQEVCPWNRKARSTSLSDLLPRIDPSPGEVGSEEEFREIYRGTPVLRAGYEKFKELLFWAKR